MPHLLLVDDNPADRLLYRRYLSALPGAEDLVLTEAASGEEALDRFRAQRPDCVLLDYSLPDTDGLAMLAAFQQLAPPDTLCVVMVTGHGSESLAVQALQSGALDYLVKGKFDRELLQKTVRHALDKNEWRQRLARHHAELQVANAQITARNHELACTNQDLDNFVYAASHDLKQPVNNLRGLFEELRRCATFSDPEQATLLGMVDDSLTSLATIVYDLAAVVQQERQAGEPPAEPVALAALTADVWQALQPQVAATQARLDVDFSGLAELRYVRSNLRTILLNLLGNALKYRHHGRPPAVRVRAYQTANGPVLEVTDNGLGINLARDGGELFHLFRRFHPQASEGTGVGLFLVNRLVQAPGGHIQVESEEGQGTTFRLFLGPSRVEVPVSATT